MRCGMVEGNNPIWWSGASEETLHWTCAITLLAEEIGSTPSIRPAPSVSLLQLWNTEATTATPMIPNVKMSIRR